MPSSDPLHPPHGTEAGAGVDLASCVTVRSYDGGPVWIAHVTRASHTQVTAAHSMDITTLCNAHFVDQER